MKKLLTLLLIVFAFAAKAQTKTFPIDTATKKITYSEVISIAGATQADLYKRSKNLGVAGTGIQKDDAAQGLYVYKGSFSVTYPAPQVAMKHTGTVDYIVTIACKDGRYKYMITNFVHMKTGANGGKLEGSQPECGKAMLTLAGWGSIKAQTMAYMDTFILNLKTGMGGNDVSVPKVGNNW